jgi:archaellum component FlaG (FlaF/FlaG flagellin family)
MMLRIILFITILILVSVGLTMQHNNSTQLIQDNFKSEQYSKTLHINEDFRLLFDKIQYEFKIMQLQNI